MAQIRCVVVTPEATILDEQADFVVVPLYDGEKGIAPGHAPTIGRLGYGELRITVGNNISRFYVDGGFVEIADNVVSVLSNHAIAAGKLDAADLTTKLAEANQMRANIPELFVIRDRKVAQARAQLKIAEKSSS